MNFSDESYVRLYVRDTKTWLRLGFAGQCVLMFLLRKLDRAGVLDGIEDLCPDVSLITGVPDHIVEIGLPRLLESGVFELRGDRLVMPNFLSAQSAVRTDKARQRDARDKRLAEARLVTGRDEPVTPRDETVTGTETAQQPVTPSIDLAKPNQAKPRTNTSPSAPVRVVFDHWRSRLKHSRAALDSKRERAIRQALKLYTPEDLCKAIDGCSMSDFHMGRDPNSRGVHDDISLICRDAEHVEKFIRFASGDMPNGRAGPTRFSTPDDRLRAQADRIRMLEEQERAAE